MHSRDQCIPKRLDGSRAWQIFDGTVLQGFRTHVIAYAAVISACGQGCRSLRTCEFLNSCEYRPNSFECVRTELGTEWHCRSSRDAFAGLQPDATTFNAVVSACGEGWMAERALHISEEMQMQGL